MKILIILLLIMIVYAADDVSASHNQGTSKPCSVRAQGQLLPVLYDGSPRNNPDGSFYPGDSFYYFVEFSASPTCVGLRIDQLKSYDGLGVDSHNVTSWQQVKTKWYSQSQSYITRYIDPLKIMTEQSHTNLGRYIKNFETVHYLRDDGSTAFSIREDQRLSSWQRKNLDRYTTYSTWDWDFAIYGYNHPHVAKCTPEMLNNPYVTRDKNILTDNRGRKCQIDDEYVDSVSKLNLENLIKSKCSKMQIYRGCVFGKVTIGSDVSESKCLFSELYKARVSRSDFPDSDKCINLIQKIEQKITGYKQVCSENSRGVTQCKSIPIPQTVTFEPDILVPDLNVVLTKEILADTDGYDAQNLDGTHYVWDPITIKHVPELKWKNHRDNTISFEIKKHHDLHLEKQLHCNDNSCDVSLEHPGIMPFRQSFGNGDGISIYNATSLSDLGLHHFTYDVISYNNDIILDTDTSSIDGLVVRYDPKYSQYPYSVLSDDERTAYENRAGVALHYFGSMGGGPDDTGVLHQDRRSKINDFSYAGIGFDPWLPVAFNDTLSWSAAHDVGILIQDPDTLSVYPAIKYSENNDTIPCDIDGPQTVMLVRSGYCKIYFQYPILDTVSDSTGPKYENATLFNTLISEHFAGADVSYLLHYEYRFPESFFNTNLSVVSLRANNTVNPVLIHIDVAGIIDNKTVPLPQYIYEKIIYDSYDPGFAKIISDDVYPMVSSESGIGAVDVELRRVSSKFETYSGGQNQNVTGLDITRLSVLYLENSNAARLAVPLDVGLGSLSPLSVTISTGDISRQYTYDYMDFSVDNKIVLNVAHNNTLDVWRYNGLVTIAPSPSFGEITKLYIDGILKNATCNVTCNINTPDNSAIEITVENFWGGQAHAAVAEFIPEKKPPIATTNLFLLALFVLLLVPVYWVYRQIKNRK